LVTTLFSSSWGLTGLRSAATQSRDVRFVPQADILRCGRDWHYSITSSAVASWRNVLGKAPEHADPSDTFVVLLRVGGERPRRHAADKADELS
jgi:hypothetical protein